MDLAQAPLWTTYLKQARLLDGTRPGRNRRVRYDLELPGNQKARLTLQPTTWTPPRVCAGDFVEGPLQGTWSYSYSEAGGVTTLVMEMDYQLGGLLRFAGGLLKSQYEAGIRRSMGELRHHLEAGPGQDRERAPARARPRGSRAAAGTSQAAPAAPPSKPSRRPRRSPPEK